MVLLSALPCPTQMPSAPPLVVIVAPSPDARSHVQEYARHGWECLAVALHPECAPVTYTTARLPDAYPYVITHRGSARADDDTAVTATVRRLRVLRRTICAVVPGSPLGVPLAERLTASLSVPGNSPDTTPVRCDRGLQAQALASARPPVTAPAGLRTMVREEAVQWGRRRWLAARDAGTPRHPYVVLPADTAVRAPARICRNLLEVEAAWGIQQQAAIEQGNPRPHLVIQEHLQGTHYLAHSVTTRRADDSGHWDHTITQIWSETRTADQRLDYARLLPAGSLAHRRLSAYTARVLDVLGVTTGGAHLRILYGASGPMLLSARACTPLSPADPAIRAATGTHTLAQAVRASVTGAPPPQAHHRPALMRVALHLPATGRVDPYLWKRLHALPTVAPGQETGPLTGDTLLAPANGREELRAELLLRAERSRDLEDDLRAIRAFERAGLYRSRTRQAQIS